MKSSDEIFVDWIKENRMNLYRFALSIVKNRTDAEDAVCEAIARGYEHLDSLKDLSKLSAWMMKIQYNVAKTMYVKRKREIAIGEEGFPEIEYIQETDHLMPVVNQLKEKLQAVIILYYYMGYQTKEMAGILGIREGTVKSRLSRAREVLRTMLEEEAV